MDSKTYKYYLIPSTGKYVKIDIIDGIFGYNIIDVNTDKTIPWYGQDGSTDLEVHEIIQIGRAIEHCSHVVAERVEYDPYYLWPAEIKKVHLQ